jgi:hypothetical protein
MSSVPNHVPAGTTDLWPLAGVEIQPQTRDVPAAVGTKAEDVERSAVVEVKDLVRHEPMEKTSQGSRAVMKK